MKKLLKKTTRFFRKLRRVKFPHWALPVLVGLLGVVVVVKLLTPSVSKWINTPRDMKLKKAAASTNYLYVAGNKDLDIFVGEKESNKPTITLKSKEDSLISFTLSQANPDLAEPVRNGNEVVFTNVRQGVDLRYQTLPNGIKEEIILTQKGQGNSFAFDTEIHRANPKMITSEFFGPIFYDQDDNYLFHFEKPYAIDAAGVRTDDVILNIRRQAKDGNEYKIIVTVPLEWLNSPERVYPINIDPTVIHDTTGEFSPGQLNRVNDTGSGSLPTLETFYQELPADEHTVGLWHMNEGSGNILDSSGNSNTGTPTGTTVVSGKFDNGRSFNGTSDYISVTENDVLDPTEITIEAWLNISTPEQVGNFVDKGGNSGYRFRTAGAGNVQFLDRGATNSITSTGGGATPGEWHHVAVTGDSSGLKIYIDGKLDVSNSVAYGGANTASNLIIGSYTTLATEFYFGSLDEVRISNIARTPEEIKAAASRRPYSVYTSDVIDLTTVESWTDLLWDEWGVATGDGETVYDSTGLVAQWNFNETSGTTADNAEGTAALDGTLTGFDSTASQDADPDSSWTANNKRWGAGGLQFDGTDSYTYCTDANCGGTGKLDFLDAESFSYGAWFKTSKSDAAQVIMSKQTTYNASAGWSMWISTDNKVYCNTHDGTDNAWAASTSTVNDGEWHYVVCNINHSTQETNIYLDGAYESLSYISTINSLDTTSDFRTGSQGSGGTYFQGIIDVVTVYSRILPAHEILSNYNAANIEFQTRVGTDTSPDDGSWDAWTPTTGETSIYDFDDGESTNWGYRKAIAISHTGTAVTEYQVLVDGLDTATLITNDKMQSDCGDLRFTNSSGTLMPYSIVGDTCNTSDTEIWVQTDSIPASGGATIYMFYGNPAANNYSNEMDTFSYSSEKNVAYILHSTVSDLEIISLANNNSITHNGTTVNLDKYKTNTGSGFGGGSISQFAPISAKAPFNADDDADDTDSIVPISWASTEHYFYSRDVAENVSIWAIAPWGNATVTVYGQGTAATGCNGVTVTTTGSTLTCTGVGQGSVRISSSVPIIAFAQPTNADDQMPIYPISNSARIGSGSTSSVINGNSTLDYSYYYDTSASQQNPANLAANGYATVTGGTGYGVGAMLVQSDDSNQSFGFSQTGDGDGGDGHIHVSTIEQGTTFGSANQADYISIASTQPATCSVYETSDNSLVGSGTATSSNTEVYFLGLGTGDSIVYTTGGWYMECDYPVSAHFQDETAAEENLVHPAMNRQFTYPTPSVGTPGSEATLASHTGSWVNINADNLETVSLSSNTIIEMEGTATEQIITGQVKTNSDTIGLWHFDETGGTGAYLKDSSGNANHATPVAPTVTQGISGKARDFDGTDDYVQILDDTAADALGTDFSISAWFKSEATAGNVGGRIFGRDCSDFFCAYVDQSAAFPQDLKVNIDDATALKTFTGVIDSGWNKVTMTWDNTNVRVYLNGVQLGNYTFTGFLTTDRPIVIGDNTEAAPSPGSSPFDGIIDEVMISDTTLTAEEVAESYRLGRDHYFNKTISSTDLSGKSSLPFYIAADRPGTYLETTAGESAYANYQPDANTVGLWHLDEGTDNACNGGSNDACDSSGNGNHLNESSSPPITQGRIGKARDFSNGVDYLTCTDANCGGTSTGLDFGTSETFSYGTWVSTTSTASYDAVMGKKESTGATGAGYSMYFNTDGTISCLISDDTLSTTSNSTSIINNGKWHHVACVIDGSNINIYVNGILEKATTNSVTGSYDNALDFRIGLFGNGFNPHEGNIDEVFVTSNTLTASEIRQAYEVGLRTHPITIDFAAALDSGNLITGSGDTSFTVDATAYGLEDKGSALYKGDKVIVRENYDGTEYIAQGTVTAVTASTGAVTITAWDSGSTFHGSGYTANANIFKWQREYWPVADNTLSTHMGAITNLTLRLTNGNEGRTIWLDDLQSSSGYLTDKTGSTITSAINNQYFQYRAIMTSLDEAVSATLSAVTLDYVENTAPATPSLDVPTDTATNQSLLPALLTTTTDADSDYLRYKIDVCENVGMSTNCNTYDQTSSQTGWSGQNAETSTAYTSGTQATYAIQSNLTASFTYYWRSYAIDPGGINTWSSTQGTPYSFTTTAAPTAPTTPYTEGSTNPTNVVDLTPEFSAVHNDSDGDSADYYQIVVDTQVGFDGTEMWDSGKTSMTTTADGVRSPNISYAGTSLSLDDSTYYWHIKFWDTLGTEGAYSATSNFGMNIAPTTPSLDVPTDTATNQALLPVLKTTGTDADSDYLRYKIDVCENVGMSTNCNTYDQTSSQVGWSGQDAQATSAYASGTQATYTLQSVLAVSTTYYWRSYGIDPGGTNTWSSTQGTPYSFTTTSTPTRQSDCRISEASDDSQNTIIWTDAATNEDYYQVDRSEDAAAWSTLSSTIAADSSSYVDSTITTSHTYYYRVAPYLTAGPTYGEWCYTDTLTQSLGSFKFN